MSALSLESARPYYTVDSAHTFLMENDANYRQRIADANAHQESLRNATYDTVTSIAKAQEPLKALSKWYKPNPKADAIYACCALLFSLAVIITLAVKGKIKFR